MALLDDVAALSLMTFARRSVREQRQLHQFFGTHVVSGDAGNFTRPGDFSWCGDGGARGVLATRHDVAGSDRQALCVSSGMPRILVLYGTTNGHTAKVAHAIGETLQRTGADVEVIDSGRETPHPEDYAGIVVAASVQAGGYQKAVRRWVRRYADDLKGKPTAFVSVCLGVLQREPKVQREVAAVIHRFLTTTRWHPTVTRSVAGALLYTRYNWVIRSIMRRIAAKAGGDTDTSRDYEYTDWSDLRTFAEEFGEIVRARETLTGRTGSARSIRVA